MRRKRPSRTFTSSHITCGQRQPSPGQFAHFLCQAITGPITFLFKISKNWIYFFFFNKEVGGRGQKDNHDKSIGKRGPVSCSWQSSLWAIQLKQWIMGAALKHLQQSWPCTTEKFLLPPSSLQWIHLCFTSVWACQALPQPQSEQQLSLCGFQPLVLKVDLSNPTETWRQHLEEHQCWWTEFQGQ